MLPVRRTTHFPFLKFINVQNGARPSLPTPRPGQPSSSAQKSNSCPCNNEITSTIPTEVQNPSRPISTDPASQLPTTEPSHEQSFASQNTREAVHGNDEADQADNHAESDDDDLDAKQPADDANVIDVIAIHGLNGHYQKIWSHPESNVNWLMNPNFLPRDLPTARIMSFSYNSIEYFSKSNADVKDFASDLLADYKSLRRAYYTYLSQPRWHCVQTSMCRVRIIDVQQTDNMRGACSSP
jgi:hypothetical protein